MCFWVGGAGGFLGRFCGVGLESVYWQNEEGVLCGLFWSRSGGREGVEFGLDVVAEFGGCGVVIGHVFGVEDGEGVFDGF